MDQTLSFLIYALASLILVWLLSFLINMLNKQPPVPEKLAWAPDIDISYVDIDGVKIRYVKAGDGPVLVLLHTLRTQLDLFQKILPELSRNFTVYALDYPGHGYSDIPPGPYAEPLFTDYVGRFLEAVNVRDATLVGVSIGGPIALRLAASGNRRIAKVIAINSYDYAKGRGMARGSLLAGFIVYSAQIPVIGETIMRFRNRLIMNSFFQSEVADPASLPPQLLKEMNDVGHRAGHYRAFISLLRSAASWEKATDTYGNISVPVLLIWGDEDWSHPAERAHDLAHIPGAREITIANGGHFLPLDQPKASALHIAQFAQGTHAPQEETR